MKSEIKIKILNDYNKKTVAEIVEIHLSTFKGFFLTFMGSGFLHQMYSSYLLHSKSGIIIAEDESRVIGFLAYSTDMSGLYKYMIKHRLPQFAWYSIGAFFRKPGAFMRLLRAFLKPGEAKRDVEYVELASITFIAKPPLFRCGKCCMPDNWNKCSNVCFFKIFTMVIVAQGINKINNKIVNVCFRKIWVDFLYCAKKGKMV